MTNAAPPASQTPASRGYAWMVVALLWFVALLNYLDRLMITTMRDPIRGEIGISDAQFGLLTAVFLWVYGVLSPVGGFLADRFSRRAVIVVSLGVWSLVTWWTGHAHSYGELLCARACMGFSEACYIPAGLALIADYHRGPTRSLATGLHMSGVFVGSALGGLGGYLAEGHGWRFGFSLFGAIGVGYALLMALILRDATPAETSVSTLSSPSTLRMSSIISNLASIPAFRILFVLNALIGVANWSINGWLPTYLREHFGLGLGNAGLSATGYNQIAAFLGVIAGGLWADRWIRSNTRARALVPAIGYCVAGPCLFLAATSNTLSVAVLGVMVFGLARGFFDANHMPILRAIADERISATGYGLLNCVSCITGGLMIYVGGWLNDVGIELSRVFQFSAIGLAVAGLLLFTIRFTQSRCEPYSGNDPVVLGNL